MNLKRLAIHAASSYQWSRSRQDESGRWRGDSPTGCAAYYKAPWGFLAAGDQHAAQNSLAHIQARFLLPNGDLGHLDNRLLSQRHPLYPHGHVAVGAARSGRLDVADRLLGFLLTQRHDRLAGWGDRSEAGESRTYGSVSTACIGLAFLERGDLDRARGAVDFLVRLLAIQPNPETDFFYSVSDEGNLITASGDGKPDSVFRVRFADWFQVWWALSFPLILLARFAELTNEAEAWQTANRYLALLDRSPQAWNDLSAGKLALGCALMYRHSGDPRYKTRALQAVRAVVSRIGADGGWHACQGGEGGTSDAPTAVGFEVNLEFTLMMSWVGHCLAARDGVPFPEPASLERPGVMDQWVCRSERALLRFGRTTRYRFHASGLGKRPDSR